MKYRDLRKATRLLLLRTSPGSMEITTLGCRNTTRVASSGKAGFGGLGLGAHAAMGNALGVVSGERTSIVGIGGIVLAFGFDPNTSTHRSIVLVFREGNTGSIVENGVFISDAKVFEGPAGGAIVVLALKGRTVSHSLYSFDIDHSQFQW